MKNHNTQRKTPFNTDHIRWMLEVMGKEGREDSGLEMASDVTGFFSPMGISELEALRRPGIDFPLGEVEEMGGILTRPS